MNRNQRDYNGLHLPNNSLHVPAGQVPQFGSGSQEEQMKRAIALEMQALTREIYVECAAVLIDTDAGSAEFSAVAKQAHEAAQSFFVGLGIIQRKPNDPPEQDPG